MKPNLTPELREYISRFADPKLLLRAMLVLAVLELGALLLGIAFFIIIQGLFLGVAWFFLYWKPAFAIGGFTQDGRYLVAVGENSIEIWGIP